MFLVLFGTLISAKPCEPFDLQGFIDQKIADGIRRIVIPPGTYRVVPVDGHHLLLRGLENVEIIADNVEMICTETTRAITIENCSNLTLRGMTIDYDPLPFTQGRITAMAPDKSWLEFELFDGYPDDELVHRVEIFDQTSHTLKRAMIWSWQPFEALGDRRYRLAKGENDLFNPEADLEEIGDILVTNHRHAPGGYIPHAIVTSNSSGIVFENITLFSSNLFGFLETYCDGTIYRNCIIDRRPLETDLKPRGYQRMRSLNADAFHSKHARVGPQILNCTAKYMGDDAVNICGEYYLIMNSRGPTLRILATGDINLEAGNPVELVSYTGERLPNATVTHIDTDGTVQEEEIDFLAVQGMNREIRSRLSQQTARGYKITLDRDVELPRGSVIASLHHTGRGFRIENCDFGMNRSRGILVKAGGGRILNNRIQGTWEYAILAAPEWWWLESGHIDGLEIRNNIIRESRDVSIAVTARGGNRQEAPAGAHTGIRIIGNHIDDSPFPAVFVSSTRDLTIDDNTFPANPSRLKGWPAERIGLNPSGPPPAILLSNCKEVSGNNLTPDVKPADRKMP